MDLCARVGYPQLGGYLPVVFPVMVWALLLVGALFATGTASAAEPAPRILVVQPSAREVDVFSKLELAVDLEAAYTNPFDPDQIDLTARFYSPTGKSYQVIGFYARDVFRAKEYGGQTLLKDTGGWYIRFAPPEPGQWTYEVSLRTPAGTATTPIASFAARANAQATGFLRATKGKTPHFVYDNGSPYFAIGENLAWWDKNPGAYDIWLPSLARNGANYMRIWMASWSFAIEWNNTPLGNYMNRQEQAYQLDYVLDAAAELGINVMLCLQNHGQFSARTNPEWANNPYNQALGGPLANPQDFFTNATARKFAQQRYRYIVARYGHHTNLLAWELFNEVDLTDNYNSAAIAAWHQEMANYIRSIDPYNHLITTSYANAQADSRVWSLPELDFTNTHFYNVSDMAATATQLDQAKLAAFAKPTFAGEFGTNAGGPGAQDTRGVNLHNALWSSISSGASGTPMTWWWESYIHPLNLYPQFQSLATFVQGEDWWSDDWYTFNPIVQTAALGDLTFSPNAGWGNKPSDVRFAAGESGMRQPAEITQFLHGVTYNTNLRTAPIEFTLNYNHPVEFGVTVVTAARSGARLEIAVDGQTALTQPFAPAGQDVAVNKSYTVPIPAGRHVVTVQNQGIDWLVIGAYFVRGGASKARAFGRRNADSALVWVQDRDHTWAQAVAGYQPPVVSDASMVLDMPSGAYKVEFYDTWQGKTLEESLMEATNGRLHVDLPAWQGDIAVKVHPVES